MGGRARTSLRQGRAASRQLIVALDATSLAPALRLAARLQGAVQTVKVGSALFTACGPAAIQRLRAMGFDVMLDLKFFDIPNTVELSCRAATRLGVSRLTVHAAGGRDMVHAAVRGVREEAKRMRLAPQQRPRILAVTVLTSVAPPPDRTVVQRRPLPSAPETTGGQRAIRLEVLKLVDVALEAGCGGVVASAQEAGEFRRAFPDGGFEIVCAGIRPSWASRDDQRRIATPAQALAAGADVLVVGRPITAARDPRTAALRILSEMEGATTC